MKLYHGSNTVIETIDLSKGKKGKDFGQGFYLSDTLAQAERMAELTVAKTGEGTPTVTVFEFDEKKIQNLNTLTFDSYTKEWADFIIRNRNNRAEKPIHSYDFVYGPIADDTVGATISLFQRHYISIEEMINRIQFTKPKFQYFFATPAAIASLTKL